MKGGKTRVSFVLLFEPFGVARRRRAAKTLMSLTTLFSLFRNARGRFSECIKI